MLQCRDRTFYVGVTNSIDRRLAEHQTGIHPECYTYDRRPVSLVFVAEYRYILDAIDRGKQLKGWSRQKKQALMQEEWSMLHTLSECRNNTHARNRGVTVTLRLRSV